MQTTEFARHLIDRLGYGPRPGDLAAIARLGADAWIGQQFRPASLALPQELTARLGTLETLSLSPGEAFMRFGPQTLKDAKDDPEKRKQLEAQARLLPAEAIEARILRAVYSPRQLEETLTDFWFNHFNVFVGKGLDRVWISAYERDAIRPHVLGRFRDLLGATAKHPAMLFYLDNWQNSAPDSKGARGRFDGLNENYARELMELHTLGVDGGYTQADVIALAKILTGWGLGGPGVGPAAGRGGAGPIARLVAAKRAQGRGGFVFADNRHDFSEKIFLGQKIPGSGESEGENALDMLARHPATARHISHKLAQFYLADEPDPQVVAQMAATFTKTDGQIAAVLKTLFASAVFRDPANFGTRFKTPLQYVISAIRASGTEVRNFRPVFGTLTQLGQPLYGCQTPDGYKCTESAWLNADAMTRRVTFAIALASGRLPLTQDPGGAFGAQNSEKENLAAARGLNARKPERAAERMPLPNGNAPQVAPPVDANTLIATLGDRLSDQTRATVASAVPELRAALVLGSPDFMRC